MAAKSAKKAEFVQYNSPFGTTRFPKISAPDTDGKFPDGKFKTALLLDEDEVAAERKKLQAAAKTLLPKVPLDEVNLPLKEMFDKDRDTGEKKSVGWGLKAASKRRPVIFDAKKNKMPEGVKIGGGTVLRIGGVLKSYERTETETVVENGKKTKQQVTIYGLTYYLNSVQIKSLSAGGGESDGSEFEEVEGFEYEASEGETGGDFAGDATDL